MCEDVTYQAPCPSKPEPWFFLAQLRACPDRLLEDLKPMWSWETIVEHNALHGHCNMTHMDVLSSFIYGLPRADSFLLYYGTEGVMLISMIQKWTLAYCTCIHREIVTDFKSKVQIDLIWFVGLGWWNWWHVRRKIVTTLDARYQGGKDSRATLERYRPGKQTWS